MATPRKPRAPSTPPTPSTAPLTPLPAELPGGYEMRRFVIGPSGTEAGSEKRQLSALYELVKGRVADEARYVAKIKGVTSAAVGHIYDIPVKAGDEEGSLLFATGVKTYIGEYEDKQTVLRWQTAEVGQVEKIRLRNFEARHATDLSQLEPLVDTLRKAYQPLGTPSRVAFEIWLLTSLRRGSFF